MVTVQNSGTGAGVVEGEVGEGVVGCGAGVDIVVEGMVLEGETVDEVGIEGVEVWGVVGGVVAVGLDVDDGLEVVISFNSASLIDAVVSGVSTSTLTSLTLSGKIVKYKFLVMFYSFEFYKMKVSI